MIYALAGGSLPNYDQQILAEVLDELPDAVFCLDSIGRVIYMSRAFSTLTGLAPEQTHGVEIFDLLADEDKKAARDAFTDALLTQNPRLRLRVRLRGQQETVVWTDIELMLKLSVPVLGASSIGLFRDAQSRVQLELKLAQKQRQVLAMNRELEHLLSQSQDTLIEAGEAFRSQLQAMHYDTPYYSLRIVSRPSYFLGGDVFFYRESRHGNLLVALADAVGHGPAAALRGVAVKATALSCLRISDDPADVLRRMNEQASDYLEEGAYFTLLVIEIDFARRQARIFNCGAPPVLLHDRQVVSLSANNPPLGLYDNIRFQSHTVAYHPVTNILLLSDGWLEPQDAQGNINPISPVSAFARFVTGAPVDNDALAAAVTQLVPGARFVDDLSAVQLTLKQR